MPGNGAILATLSHVAAAQSWYFAGAVLLPAGIQNSILGSCHRWLPLNTEQVFDLLGVVDIVCCHVAGKFSHGQRPTLNMAS